MTWDDAAVWSDVDAVVVAGGRIDEASLTALDLARPYNVSIYLDQQTTAREVIQQLAASLNCVAGVSWTGQLFVVPVAIGAPDLVLAADGSALPPYSVTPATLRQSLRDAAVPLAILALWILGAVTLAASAARRVKP